MQFPENFKYTKDHEWTQVVGKTATVGITDHAQHSLGDIVYVELPEVGRKLKRGDTFGVVESIKAVSDLYSPATGTVVEVNKNLIAEPGQINLSPHKDAWLIKVEITDPSSLNDMMDVTAYTQYVSSLK